MKCFTLLYLVVIVNFTREEYIVREDLGPLIVGVQLDREIQQRIVVRVALTGNSAEGKPQ